MRHAALLAAVWGLLLASCTFPTMSLDTLACNAEHACVDGYVCHQGQCLRPMEVPPDTACEAALLDKPCSVGQGTCARTGVTACVSGRVACSVSAGTSSSEVCDGQDNDCDGQADEELAVPTCALSQGVCAASRPTCQGAAGWSACTYPAQYEQDETSCDGLDNDCDGVVDEVPGCMVTIAGDGPPGFRDGPAATARFFAARHLTRDAQGRVWVADQNNHAIRRIDTDGTVTTVVGDGTCGMQDGAVATAKLCYPYDVEVAADGTVYFSDFNNDRVRAIRGGQVLTVVGSGASGWGDGGALSGKLDGPAGITLLANGDILIADKNNNRIRRYIASTSTLTTVAGSGTAGNTDGDRATVQLNRPVDVVEDSQGTLYVSETSAHRIRRIPVSGTSSTLAGSTSGTASVSGTSDTTLNKAGTAALFNTPEQLLLDEAGGNLYVADSLNMRVRRVPLDNSLSTSSVVGSSSTTIGFVNGIPNLARLNNLTGIARVAGNPTTWLLVEANGVIRSAIEGTGFTDSVVGDFAGGVAAEIGKDGPALEARMRRPLGLTRLADGTLYWAEREGGVLRRLTLQGRVETVVGDSATRKAGYTNGALSSALLNNPRDVQVGPDGRLYIPESANHVVRVVDLAAGTVDTFAGPATAISGEVDSDDPTAARFYGPRAVAFGKNGAGQDVLYVSDELNCKVRMVELSTRRVTTLAGQKASCTQQDTTQTTAGSLKAPGPLVADAQGNVYVADGMWLRHIKPDGTITTPYKGTANINGVAWDGSKLVVVTDQAISGLLIEGSSVVVETLFQSGVNGWQNGSGSQAGAMRLTGVVVLPDRFVLTDENAHRVRQLGR